MYGHTGHTGGHIGGGHMPPAGHQPHPGHQPATHHHHASEVPRSPWFDRGGRGPVRLLSNPRIAGAVIFGVVLLTILLVVTLA